MICGCDLSGSHQFPADREVMCPGCAPLSACLDAEVSGQPRILLHVAQSVLPGQVAKDLRLMGAEITSIRRDGRSCQLNDGLAVRDAEVKPPQYGWGR